MPAAGIWAIGAGLFKAPRCSPCDYQSKVSDRCLIGSTSIIEVSVGRRRSCPAAARRGSAEVARHGWLRHERSNRAAEGAGRRSNTKLDGDLLDAHATPDEAGANC